MNLKEAYHNQGENQLKYIDNDIGQMVNENTGYLVTVGSDSYQNLAGWEENQVRQRGIFYKKNKKYAGKQENSRKNVYEMDGL